MAVSGPDLSRLRKRVREVASPSFRTGVLMSLAEEARRLIWLGFQQSRSPDGNAWERLKYREGMPLLDSGRLRNSIQVTPTQTGISVRTNLVYAATHQYGRDHIPARPFLPVGHLPETWAAPFRRLINGAVRRAMGT